MIGITVFLVFFASVCANFEELDDCWVVNCTEKEKCYNSGNCISQYDTLESYILNNNEVLSTLARTFYKSNGDPTKFAKIIYLYQLLNATDVDNSTCTDHKSVFFWSTSPSFLLGPGPMFWLSLFAINPAKANVTVKLPCLYQDSRKELLHRLTYLIKVYAVKKYDDQGLEFASRFYFEADSNLTSQSEDNDNNFDSVILILMLANFMPLWAFMLVGNLASLFLSYLESMLQDHINKYQDLCHLKATAVMTSIVLKTGFVFCHVFSIKQLSDYAREILFDEETPEVITYNQAIISIIALIIAVLVLLILVYLKKIRCLKAFIVMDFIYFGYFLPYMLLAFIDNPLQAVFIYALLFILMAFIFILLYTMLGVVKSLDPTSLLSFNCKSFLLFYTRINYISMLICCIGTSIVYFIACVILLLNLGGADNFGELKTRLFWPVSITVLLSAGAYFLKYIYKKESSRRKEYLSLNDQPFC